MDLTRPPKALCAEWFMLMTTRPSTSGSDVPKRVSGVSIKLGSFEPVSDLPLKAVVVAVSWAQATFDVLACGLGPVG